MSVSIWEGNKAQALIDAVARTQKIDKQQGSENAGKVLMVGSDGLTVPSDNILSSDVADALLTCFRHVAWVDASGQDFYDALEAAISGAPAPEFDHTLLYQASSGILLSNAEGLEVVDTIGDLQQTISNDILNVQLPAGSTKSHYVMIRKADYTPSEATKAAIKCKYRINNISAAANSDLGVALIMKSGSSCAGIYTHRNTSNQYYFSVYNSSNAIVDTSKQLNLSQWYEVEAYIENGTQTVKVDGEIIYTGSGNTKFESSGVIFTRTKDNVNVLNADIEWLKIQYS